MVVHAKHSGHGATVIGLPYVCASNAHREELMQVFDDLRQQNSEQAAEIRKLDAECQRLAGEKFRLQNNALELAKQLDQMKADYWAVCHAREADAIPAPTDNAWPTACQWIGLLGAFLCGAALTMGVVR